MADDQEDIAAGVSDEDLVQAEGFDFQIGDEKPPIPTYPLVRHLDLPEDTSADIVDMVSSYVERYIDDLVLACKCIKETMDRLYNPGWHAVVGEHFGFEVTYDAQNLVYVFTGGNLGILVWKCTL